MGKKDPNEGKRVALMVIIVLILMVLITIYEFVQCASGNRKHDGWDKTHVELVKPAQKCARRDSGEHILSSFLTIRNHGDGDSEHF